jgi:hypothetical protein
MDSVYETVDHQNPGPRWIGHGRAGRAHRSLASDRFGAQGRWSRCRRGGEGHGEPILGLTGGQVSVRRLGGGEHRQRLDVVGGGALGGGRGEKGD